VADLAIGVGGASCPPHPPTENLVPLDGNFKLYMNHCHLYPVNIFFYKHMRNALFRFLIPFDVFDELQLIYKICQLWAPLKFSAAP